MDRLDAWVERSLSRLERVVTHYAQNRNLLYRPYLLSYLLLGGVELALVVQSTVDPLLPRPGAYVVSLLALRIVSVGLATLTINKLSARSPSALTLFGLTLLFMLLSGHVLYVLLGLYVVGNRAFRTEWRPRAPEWYGKLVTVIEGEA